MRFQLVVWFVAIFGFTLVGFSGLVYQVFVRSQQQEFDASLYNHAVDIADGIAVNFFGDLSVRLSEGEKILPFALAKALLQIRDIDGRVLARSRTLGTGEIPLDAGGLSVLLEQTTVFETIEPHDFGPKVAGLDRRTSYRLLNVLIRRPAARGLILQIAVPTSFLQSQRRGLLTFFLIAVPGVLIVAILGGWFLSERAIKPVAAMIAKARGIGAGDLAERVPVPDAEDEIRRLAETVNGLLERLQRAFESQERFVADASHQMKTPLAILRGELDVIRSRPRSPEEMSGFLESASQEIDFMSRMIEDLLLLARVDAGARSLAVQTVRLDEITLEVVAQLDRLASARRIQLRVNLGPENGSFEVPGDPDLLRCLVQNLVENAIKYSPEGSRVEIECRDEGGAVGICVADQGPGVAPEDAARIFERFHRSDRVANQVGGSGLGLAIARRIAEAHGGVLRLDPPEIGHGAVFRARLKKLSSAFHPGFTAAT